MLKLVKYLKSSIGPILLVVALLVVQAMCDLALPEYTSRIVNVGIQQGGDRERGAAGDPSIRNGAPVFVHERIGSS